MLEEEVNSFFREEEITEKSYEDAMMQIFTYYEKNIRKISETQLNQLYRRRDLLQEYKSKGITIKYYYDRKLQTIMSRVIH